MTIGVSVMGTGRMGRIHALNAARHPAARLVSVVNPRVEGARALAAELGCEAGTDPAEAIADPRVDAVVISSPTSTHLELVTLAARAGKAILCEKPLDLSLERVDAAMAVLEETGVPFMLGFNRRFDPAVRTLRDAVAAGEAGRLEMLLLTSRDPAPPPMDYVLNSGGYFADSTIHDIDLACWISGQRPVEVFATGSCLVEPAIGQAGDIDTAMTVLALPDGALVHVNNSRRSVYGFDQRIEAFGSGGMLQTINRHEDDLRRSGPAATFARAPLKHFFLERYEQSFALMLDEFVCALRDGREPSATRRDGRDALVVALACARSRREGRAIRPEY